MLITAHRGASGAAPENSISALKTAIAHGANMVEFDVQQTRDGEIVLFHDQSINRTTGGTGNLSEISWSDLRNLDAGSWFHPNYAGEAIPLLSDALDVCKDRVQINLEIKTSFLNRPLITRILESLDRKGCTDQTVITSFHHPNIRYIHRIDPRIRTGCIFYLPLSTKSRHFHSPCSLLSVHWMLVDKKFVEVAHRHHKEVHVWTVNQPEVMLSMIQCGVDNIITDHPALLRSLILQKPTL